MKTKKEQSEKEVQKLEETKVTSFNSQEENKVTDETKVASQDGERLISADNPF